MRMSFEWLREKRLTVVIIYIQKKKKNEKYLDKLINWFIEQEKYDCLNGIIFKSVKNLSSAQIWKKCTYLYNLNIQQFDPLQNLLKFFKFWISFQNDSFKSVAKNIGYFSHH